MTTALDLITGALIDDGVYAAGETISSADAADCLAQLNDMIDSWSNESLITYARQEQNFPLVVNRYQYTIGPSGNFNGTRPLRILESPGTAYVLDNQGNRYPMSVLNQDEWNLIGNISQVNADIPSKMFYDPQFPLGIINIFPVPTQTWQLYFDSWLQLAEFPSLFTVMHLPPGYGRAIRKNLALELWPSFKADGSSPGPALVSAASKSLGNIKRTNIKAVVAFYDPSIVSRASSTYNIFRDSLGAA